MKPENHRFRLPPGASPARGRHSHPPKPPRNSARKQHHQMRHRLFKVVESAAPLQAEAPGLGWKTDFRLSLVCASLEGGVSSMFCFLCFVRSFMGLQAVTAAVQSSAPRRTVAATAAAAVAAAAGCSNSSGNRQCLWCFIARLKCSTAPLVRASSSGIPRSASGTSLARVAWAAAPIALASSS